MNLQELITAYVHARQQVVDAGFLEEICWQETRTLSKVGETEFLSQLAWVVLAGGMSETVIRNLFPRISKAFGGFRSARFINDNQHVCRENGLAVFGHAGKIEAIVSAAYRICDEGFVNVRTSIKENAIEYLQTYSYLGPATSYHLAKNLGVDVVKPDRHLLRFADVANYESPACLCKEISDFVGERVAVVDLILWRYATLSRSYLSDFTQFCDTPSEPSRNIDGLMQATAE